MRKKQEKAKVEDPLEAKLNASLPALYVTGLMLSAVKGLDPEKHEEAIATIKKVDELFNSDPKLQSAMDLKEHVAQVFIPNALLIYPRAPECVFDTLKIVTDLKIDLNEHDLIHILDQLFLPCLLLHGTKYTLIEDTLLKALRSETGLEGIVSEADVVIDDYSLIHETKEIYRKFSDKATKDGDPLAHKIATIRSIFESDDSLRTFLLQGNHGGDNLVTLGSTLFSAATKFPLKMELYPLRHALEEAIERALTLTTGLWNISSKTISDALNSPHYVTLFGSTPIVTKATLTGETAGEFSSEVFRAVALPAEDTDSCKVTIDKDICKNSEGEDDPYDITISPLKAGTFITPSTFFSDADEFEGYCPAKIEDNYLVIGPSLIFTEINSLILKIPCDLENGEVFLYRNGDTIGIHTHLEQEPVLTLSLKDAQNFEVDVAIIEKSIIARETRNHENVYILEEDDLSDNLYSALELLNAVTGSSTLSHLDNIHVTKDGMFSSGFLPQSRKDTLPFYDIFIADSSSPFLLACELIGLNRKRAFYTTNFLINELMLSNSDDHMSPGFNGFSEAIEDLIGGSAIADFICNALRKGYVSREEASPVVERLKDLTVVDYNLRPFMTQSFSGHQQNFKAKVSALDEALKVECDAEKKVNDAAPIAHLQKVELTSESLKSFKGIHSAISDNFLTIWEQRFRNVCAAKKITVSELTQYDSESLSNKLHDYGNIGSALAISSVFERSGSDVLDQKVKIIKELIGEVEDLFLKLEERRIARPEKNGWEDPFEELRDSLRHQIELIFDIDKEDVEDSGLSDAYDEDEIAERSEIGIATHSLQNADSIWDTLIEDVRNNDRDGFIQKAYYVAGKIGIDPDLLYLDDDFDSLRSNIPERIENTEALKAENKKNEIMFFLGHFFPDNVFLRYESAISYIVEIATSSHYEEADVSSELSKILVSLASDAKLELEDLFNIVESKKPKSLTTDDFYNHARTAQILAKDPNERFVAIINHLTSTLPSKFLLAFASKIFETEPERLIEIITMFGIREDDNKGLGFNSVEADLLSLEINSQDSDKSLFDISSDITTTPFEFLDSQLNQIRAYLELRPKGENQRFDHSLLSMLPIIVLEHSLKGQIGVEICRNGFANLVSGLRHPEIYGENATREFLQSIAEEIVRVFFDAESISDSDLDGQEESVKDLRDKKEALQKLGVKTTTSGLQTAKRAIGFYEATPQALPPTATFQDLVSLSGKALGTGKTASQ